MQSGVRSGIFGAFWSPEAVGSTVALLTWWQASSVVLPCRGCVVLLALWGTTASPLVPTIPRLAPAPPTYPDVLGGGGSVIHIDCCCLFSVAAAVMSLVLVLKVLGDSTIHHWRACT